MMTDVLTLITQTISTDTYGNEYATESDKQVCCEVESITQTEFYNAANTEINPEYRFTVFFGDYDGQVVVEYQSKRYTIYRTSEPGTIWNCTRSARSAAFRRLLRHEHNGS